MNTRVGQRFGNYRLTRLLGQGGFAEVYLGTHIYFDEQVALKLLHGHLSSQDIQSFIQEAMTIKVLTHPHIVPIRDAGMEGTMPYIVMEYAPNGTLRTRHPRGAVVPLPAILSYVKQVGAALTYTHEHKLIHRDVKPENMLLNEQNHVWLSDFGTVVIAHSTASMQTQNIIGTVHYMAPEQLRGYPTPASDQYALAIVVYEWLCGMRPFSGTNIVEIGLKHANEPIPSLREKVPQLSLAVERVVLTALAKDEKQRFPRVQDFVLALEQAIHDNHRIVSDTVPEKNPSAPRLLTSIEMPLAQNEASIAPLVIPQTSPNISSVPMSSTERDALQLLPNIPVQNRKAGSKKVDRKMLFRIILIVFVGLGAIVGTPHLVAYGKEAYTTLRIGSCDNCSHPAPSVDEIENAIIDYGTHHDSNDIALYPHLDTNSSRDFRQVVTSNGVKAGTNIQGFLDICFSTNYNVVFVATLVWNTGFVGIGSSWKVRKPEDRNWYGNYASYIYWVRDRTNCDGYIENGSSGWDVQGY